MLRFMGETISEDEIRDIIEEADVDNDGLIDYSEFYNMMCATGNTTSSQRTTANFNWLIMLFIKRVFWRLNSLECYVRSIQNVRKMEGCFIVRLTREWLFVNVLCFECMLWLLSVVHFLSLLCSFLRKVLLHVRAVFKVQKAAGNFWQFLMIWWVLPDSHFFSQFGFFHQLLLVFFSLGFKITAWILEITWIVW